MIHICFNFSIIAQPRCELGKLLHFDLVLFNKTRNTLICLFFISWCLQTLQILDAPTSSCHIVILIIFTGWIPINKKIGRVTAIRANSWSRFPPRIIVCIVQYVLWYECMYVQQESYGTYILIPPSLSDVWWRKE